MQHPQLTAEEFGAMLAEHGGSLEAELIEGEAVVIPPDGPTASAVQGELFFALRRWQEQRPHAGLVLQSVFVKIAARSTLGPDLAWWAAPRKPPRRPDVQMTVIPDWIAEVLSPSTRENDLGPKREAYLAAGVRELWLLDPLDASVTVVDADGSQRRAGATSESRVLPGFTVATARLFVW